MRIAMPYVRFPFGVLAVRMLLPAVLAMGAARQTAAGEQAQQPAETLSLHSAAEARPSLKYRLLPDDRAPTDAVPLYLQACLLWTQNPAASNDKEQDAVVAYLTAPADKFPKTEVRAALEKSRMALDLVRAAGRRASCDWGYPIENISMFETSLPELQSLRRLASLVALEARWHIVEGRFDDALASLQTGFAMARHASGGGTLVHTLVSIVIAEQLAKQIQLWVQTTSSPNLYWALAILPQPCVSLEPTLNLEGKWIESVLPQAVRFEREQLIEEEARRLASQMRTTLEVGEISRAQLEQAFPSSPPNSETVQAARRKLVDAGWPEKQVAGLGPTQTIVLGELVRLHEANDDQWKWANVPYWQVEEAAKSGTAGEAPHSALEELVPAIVHVRRAQVRLERRLAALRCVEAVRMYAASHEGRLPTTLSDVVAVPIPDDPVTGKAFDYSLSEDVARLNSGSIPKHGALEFELRLKR